MQSKEVYKMIMWHLFCRYNPNVSVKKTVYKPLYEVFLYHYSGHECIMLYGEIVCPCYSPCLMSCVLYINYSLCAVQLDRCLWIIFVCA